MQKFSKWNKGYRYLLMVIDVFSKFGWILPLKDKTGKTVANAFKKIFKEKRIPEFLWTDKGKEFYNKNQKACWTNTTLNYIQLKMKKKVLLLNAGIALSKIKCGSNLQNKVQLST